MRLSEDKLCQKLQKIEKKWGSSINSSAIPFSTSCIPSSLPHQLLLDSAWGELSSEHARPVRVWAPLLFCGSVTHLLRQLLFDCACSRACGEHHERVHLLTTSFLLRGGRFRMPHQLLRHREWHSSSQLDWPVHLRVFVLLCPCWLYLLCQLSAYPSFFGSPLKHNRSMYLRAFVLLCTRLTHLPSKLFADCQRAGWTAEHNWPMCLRADLLLCAFRAHLPHQLLADCQQQGQKSRHHRPVRVH